MNICVALLTCDRQNYTQRTIDALFAHNDVSQWPLFYADDNSTEPGLREHVESCGFEPVLLNDGPRLGCSPISDGLLQRVRERVGPDWFVLYLQNDFEAIRPIPLDVAREYFARKDNQTLRMQYLGHFWRRARQRRWRFETYGGESVVRMRTCAWPVQLARLDWLAEMASGVTSERELIRRGKFRSNQWQHLFGWSGMLAEPAFRHIGRQRTRGGKFRSEKPFGIEPQPAAPKVIVSMTTTGTRLNRIVPAVQSILAGRMKPDRLCLYVDERLPSASMHDHIRDLPIDIITTKDLGPATKFIPAAREYWGQDVLIVTADDDVRYPRKWLRKLVRASRRTPNCVVCTRARRIKRDSNGKLLPYRQWTRYSNRQVQAAHDLLPLGVGGVAFRPRFFDERLFDLRLMRKTTPRNDDLWFAAVRRAGIPVRVVRCGRCANLKLPGALSKGNVRRNENDRAIERLQAAVDWPSRSLWLESQLNPKEPSHG